ncbi:RTA1 like protein-domain-containing protein [Exophiala viscosa]|uniref:RTA1 like protein-domain-containing protein n=1 Tax=Exophiala viscosa TaxID=2486360 RepID=UPI0021A02C7C|nr:RTA1 like protein-domain-containing protein [Exophiala viscosa]
MSSGEPHYIVNGTTYIAGGQDNNCTVSICPVDLSVYGYRPSLPLSGVIIALYIISIIVQAFLGWRYKTWGFMTIMILGAIDEIIGYIGRILLYNNPFARPGFLIQIVLITIGPVFFSAAIYVTLFQIVNYISVKHSRFTPSIFYWAFVSCDLVSLILQAIGGAKSASANGPSSAGVNIALAGLSFQVATLTIFIILTVDYFIRSRAVWMAARIPARFTIFVSFLSAATLLILARCCYRVYELNDGYSRTSAALRDQPLFIGLETVPVIVATFCLIVAHPGPVFKGDQKHLTNHEKDVRGSECSAA